MRRNFNPIYDCNKRQTCRWLSILLDSSVLAVPIFLGAAWSEVGAFLPALGWAALALLFADGVPLTYIALGRRLWLGQRLRPAAPRESAPPFIAVNLIGNLLGYLLLRALKCSRLAFDIAAGLRGAGRHDDDHLLLLEDQPARGRRGRLRGFPDLDVWSRLGADFSGDPLDRLGARIPQTTQLGAGGGWRHRGRICYVDRSGDMLIGITFRRLD